MQERREGHPCFLAVVLTLTLTAWRSLAAAEGAEPEPTFARDVAPILDRWCVACHGPREQHNGLRLDGYAWLMRGGDARPAVIPGDPARSLLVAKIERRHRPAMPPRRRLPVSLVARVRAWIKAGAPP